LPRIWFPSRIGVRRVTFRAAPQAMDVMFSPLSSRFTQRQENHLTFITDPKNTK
jgi:hypothetical protein